MVIAGNVGFGLVWGWLLVLVWPGGSGKRPLANTITALLATTLLGGQVFYFGNWLSLAVFVITAVIAGSTHLAWRRRLSVENVQE